MFTLFHSKELKTVAPFIYVFEQLSNEVPLLTFVQLQLQGRDTTGIGEGVLNIFHSFIIVLITPHAQRKWGKVIGVGVHYNYI